MGATCEFPGAEITNPPAFLRHNKKEPKNILILEKYSAFTCENDTPKSLTLAHLGTSLKKRLENRYKQICLHSILPRESNLPRELGTMAGHEKQQVKCRFAPSPRAPRVFAVSDSSSCPVVRR